MTELFPLFLGLTSSGLTYLWIRRRTAANPVALGSAIQTVVECLGASTLFLSVNIIVGMLLIFAIGIFTPLFVSLYVLDDLILVVLSLFQGFVFQLWWRNR